MHEYAHALKRGSHVQFSPAMAEAAKKVVLVCVGEHKREVCFDADGIGENERKKLQEAILEVFRDVLVKDDAESLLLQIKSEGWAGEFVDLGHDCVVPNSAVVKAVPIDSQPRVSVVLQAHAHNIGSFPEL